jgi:predicted nucleic acid-binding protein
LSYVVDASVALKWIVPESLSDNADRLLASDQELFAPDLLLVEAANALWKKMARKELAVREAKRAFALLMESGLVVRPSGPLLPRAMHLARTIKHPVYDCVYLALGEQERAPVVTADERFFRAASRKARPRIMNLQVI